MFTDKNPVKLDIQIVQASMALENNHCQLSVTFRLPSQIAARILAQALSMPLPGSVGLSLSNRPESTPLQSDAPVDQTVMNPLTDRSVPAERLDSTLADLEANGPAENEEEQLCRLAVTIAQARSGEDLLKLVGQDMPGGSAFPQRLARAIQLQGRLLANPLTGSLKTNDSVSEMGRPEQTAAHPGNQERTSRVA